MLGTLESVRDRIITTIAADDNMNMSTADRYFHVGEDALRVIQKCILTAGVPEPERILDFGCGWGRVTRFLRAGYPVADIVACDVSPSAVKFNQQTFGSRSLQSSHDLDQISLPAGFDLIWSGSVITHITEASCRSLLRHFEQALVPDGLMVFTTHGRYAHGRRARHEITYNITDEEFGKIDQCWKRGAFGWVGYKGNAVYGISLLPPAWIFKYLEQTTELRLVAYIERGWDDHQDVIAIQKQPIHASRPG